MVAVVADAEQRFAGASEEEINIILGDRDSKNTKNVIKTAKNIPNECLDAIEQSFEDRQKKKRPWAWRKYASFEKLVLTVLAVWLEEERGLVCQKNQWFLYAIAIICCLEKWFIKDKKKKMYYVFVLCNWSFCLVPVRSSLNIIQENGV